MALHSWESSVYTLYTDQTPKIDQIPKDPWAIRQSAISQIWEPPLSPPITKTSLSELDISSIINNSKLRHDLNFDRELHFRPNLDGQKEQLKRKSKRWYWEAIAAELQLYQHLYAKYVPKTSETVFEQDYLRRVPLMFKTVKEILKEIVPDRDQRSVDEHLHVPTVMQEIEDGIHDFASTAAWLAQLLKKNCAPMRDEAVDDMEDKIRKGDAASVSAGFCDLFGVLEAMKLDVANHQIRHLRALLIEDSINLERKYHGSIVNRRLQSCAGNWEYLSVSELQSLTGEKAYKPKFRKHDTLRQWKRQWRILGTLNQIPVEANPDTGSDMDTVTADFVKRHNLKLDASTSRKIRLPTGRKIRSLGTVSLQFSFKGEDTIYERVFTVLAKAVHDVILGKAFLEQTKTIAKGFMAMHRLKETFASCFSIFSSVHLMSSNRERISGSLNGMQTSAFPDTGSDVMVISAREAKRLNLYINRNKAHRTWLEFADGSLEYTDGMVIGAEWRFGSHGNPVRCNLHVVENLTCDLILSNWFLFDTQAYLNHTTCFYDMDEEYTKNDGDAKLSMIMDKGKLEWLNKFKKLRGSKSERIVDLEVTDPLHARKTEEDREIARQLAEEDRIAQLTSDQERDIAWQAENPLRDKWLRDHRLSNVTSIPQTTTPPRLPTGANRTPPSVSIPDSSSTQSYWSIRRARVNTTGIPDSAMVDATPLETTGS